MENFLLKNLELPLNPLAAALNITQEEIKKGIFVPHNTPSKKNSKQWTGKTLISSKLSREYEKNTVWHYRANKQKFLELSDYKTKHILLCLYFIRKDNRKFDYNNISQIVLDMLVKHKWIDDDNANIIIPVFLGHTVCKGAEGVFILPK